MTSIQDQATGTVRIDSETAETIIGENTKFKGSVNTEKIIRIDGEFEGEITSTSSVLVSSSGKFKGTLKCATLKLDGYAEGTATCSELINVAADAVFVGDVTAKNVMMVDGSVIEGTLSMKSMR